ncbi:hypothetical protein [Glaciibacter flavus]|uniref:hypothetical protein n=1 Tax=Orlajensenia flava TaxID=2565934 RepID=UPI003AFFB5E2
MLKRINTVIVDVLREPGEGIGKPEPCERLGRDVVESNLARAPPRLPRHRRAHHDRQGITTELRRPPVRVDHY